MRPVQIRRGFTKVPGGSVLIGMGETRVLCTAMIVDGVPLFREASGGGWLTAEYRMLPSSTPQRRPRETGGRLDGRCTEIQRLIGRCLRAVVDLDAIGPRTVHVDCDVLQADGGTRTASITGGFVAVYDAFSHAIKNKVLQRNPVTGMVAAVSVGLVDGRAVLDLDYQQDCRADVDFNVAMTCRGRFIEVQGGAERNTFSRDQLGQMLTLAEAGIRQLIVHQRQALALE